MSIDKMIVQTEESLWQDYRNQLFRFVLRRVEDESTAEDIVHDALIRAYLKRETLRHGEKFEQWLYQITRNAVIDHYRARRPADPLPVDLIDAEESVKGNARAELAGCLNPLIASLPGHYREAITLTELQGLTQKEMASRVGLSVSGAKSRVQRARSMLEEKLLDCCRIEFDARGAIVDYESRGQCGADAASVGCDGC